MKHQMNINENQEDKIYRDKPDVEHRFSIDYDQDDQI